MASPKSKQELLSVMSESFEKLFLQIENMGIEAQLSEFEMASDSKGCGVRWQYDRCLRDMMIHLYEWQVLMRDFVKNIKEGHPRDYLPDEYRKNYHEMDKMLVEKHQQTSLEEAKSLLRQTHSEMLGLVGGLTEEELFTKGYYKNTYTTNMAAYFESVASSPYGQVLKVLKKHQKNPKFKK